jgi:glycerol-3-phosphate dehydrogenase
VSAAPSTQDVVVVGGGVTGAGVARDLALRGVSVLLLEKNDWGAGTSGSSTWMIHGGLRYLEFDWETTRLSCEDAGHIVDIARHLVHRVLFLVPVLPDDSNGIERIETVIDAVEEETGHVGVTVIEAVGHGRERGVTHEYRGRVFESRFLPKAQLTFVVGDAIADDVVAAIVDSARSGNESGDGLVWTTRVDNVMHNRTGKSLEEVEAGG